MSPRYDLSTGVPWPEPLELTEHDDETGADNGVRVETFPTRVTITVAEAGTACSFDLGEPELQVLIATLQRSRSLVASTMTAQPDPAYVAPDDTIGRAVRAFGREFPAWWRPPPTSKRRAW